MTDDGMSELIVIRCVGGPNEGTHVVPIGIFGEWPPPLILGAVGDFSVSPKPAGMYWRQSHSQLPPQPSGGHLMRGAEYKWDPDSDAANVAKAAA